MAVQDAPVPEQAMIPCKEAKEALIWAIVGIFICGIILGAVAIVKAAKAKELIANNPRLSGSGQATAAMIIGIIAVILHVAGVLINVSMK